MMNDKAREILLFIQRFMREHGYPPTIREIGHQFGISSTNGVRYHITVLEKAGHVKRSGKISRGIIPAEIDTHPAGIPILGRVAAGSPILAEENFEGALDANDLFGDPKGLFALRVRGDSMIDAGILEGDYVVVRSQERADAGEIVVALLDDEATVKYYQPKRSGIELVPGNAKYAPIPVGTDSSFRILGVVRGVMRTVGR